MGVISLITEVDSVLPANPDAPSGAAASLPG